MEELHLAPSSGELAYCRILGRSSWQVQPGGNSQPKLLSNEEVMAANGGQPTIAKQLQRLRDHWVGHVLRTSDEHLAHRGTSCFVAR